MNALRKTVTAASALLCGIAASGAPFEKAPSLVPGAVPVQLSLPFAAVPADVLQALDPLTQVKPLLVLPAPQSTAGLDPALGNRAGRLNVKIGEAETYRGMARSMSGSETKNEPVENQRHRLDGQFDGVGDGPELPYEPEFNPPPALGTGGVVKRPLPNPAKYYPQAYEEAVYQAGRRGVARDAVSFREVTGSIPAPVQGAHLLYSFEARGKDGKAYIFYVDFAPEWAHPGQAYGSRSTVFSGPKTGALASVLVSAPGQHLPADVARFLRVSPETALGLARKKAALSSSVSFSVKIDTNAEYHFYDSRGAHVSVNAMTGYVRVRAKPSAKRGAGDVYRAAVKRAAAVLQKISAPRLKVADAEISAAAAEIAKYKGMPWSQSEYDGYRFNAADSLRKKGATKEQIQEFERLLEKAPILGGRFNPWAGD